MVHPFSSKETRRESLTSKAVLLKPNTPGFWAFGDKCNGKYLFRRLSNLEVGCLGCFRIEHNTDEL